MRCRSLWFTMTSSATRIRSWRGGAFTRSRTVWSCVGRGRSRLVRCPRSCDGWTHAVKWKVLPRPSSLSTQIRPPISCNQALRDGKTEAGAAVTAGGRAVGLGELLEDQRLLRGRDADAGVADLKVQAHAAGRRLRSLPRRPRSRRVR